MPVDNRQLAADAIAAINETYRSGDLAPWREHVERTFDPGVVLEAPADAFTEGEWRGHDGVVGFVANQMEVLEEMWLQLDELIEVGPDSLVAAVTFGGRARYSGLEVELRPFHLFRMREGRVLGWQIFLHRPEALAAAGLSQPDVVAAYVTAYAQRGLDGVAETWHPDVVYEEDPLWPGASTFRGRANVRERFREYEEQLGVGEVTVEAVVERAGRWVMIWRHAGTTPGAGVAFEHRWAWVVELRDGLAGHIRAYFSADEALEALEAAER